MEYRKIRLSGSRWRKGKRYPTDEEEERYGDQLPGWQLSRMSRDGEAAYYTPDEVGSYLLGQDMSGNWGERFTPELLWNPDATTNDDGQDVKENLDRMTDGKQKEPDQHTTLRDQVPDAVGIYLAGIDHRLLTHDEERDLGRRIRQGDAKAKDELIKYNLRLVVSRAKRHTGKGLDLGDMIQAGNMGLERAAAKFDPESGAKFGTYAVWWIDSEIKQAFEDQQRQRASRAPELNYASATIVWPEPKPVLSSQQERRLGRVGRIVAAPNQAAVMRELGIKSSTYYRWQKQFDDMGIKFEIHPKSGTDPRHN